MNREASSGRFYSSPSKRWWQLSLNDWSQEIFRRQNQENLKSVKEAYSMSKNLPALINVPSLWEAFCVVSQLMI